MVEKVNATGAPTLITHVSAALLAKSEHAYFYVDTALGASSDAAQSSAERFESRTWPTVTGIFGLPTSPGVDSDPHIVVLQTVLGGVGGYHTADDLYLKSVRPLSNEAEMVYIDSSIPMGDTRFDVVVAHELQHLIHARSDSGEEAWVNEGLSVVTEGIVGGALSTFAAFERRPSTQLNNWAEPDLLAHYGAGGAFLRYLADRFGGDAALGKIAGEARDGPAGIDDFLLAADTKMTFREVFADWIAANILNRAAGPYANPSKPLNVSIDKSLSVGESARSEAHQFGTDYYALSGLEGGEYALTFGGQPQVDVLPISPNAGGAFSWSNAGDNIDTTLTRQLTIGNDAPALTFSTWYDIERYYDRGYVSVSTDNGTTWRALPSTSTTTIDPVQLSYGPAFDGQSGRTSQAQWTDEQVDLSEFRGQTVLLRFEYVTDGATHGGGWVVRDVSLIDGAAATPLPDDSWAPVGWVRIDRALPQTYTVRLIGERAGGDAVVLDVPLEAQQHGTLKFNADGLAKPVLAIAGTTEGTNLRAPYTVTLTRS